LGVSLLALTGQAIIGRKGEKMRIVEREKVLRLNCPGYGEDNYLNIGKAKPLDKYQVIIANPTSLLHLFDKGPEPTRRIDQLLSEGTSQLNVPDDALIQELITESDARLEELIPFLSQGGLLVYFLCRPFVLAGPTISVDNYDWLSVYAPAMKSPPENGQRQMSGLSHGRIVELTEDGLNSELTEYFQQTGIEWNTIIRTDFLSSNYSVLATAGQKKCISAQFWAGDNGGKVIFLPSPYSPDFDKALMQGVNKWYSESINQGYIIPPASLTAQETGKPEGPAFYSSMDALQDKLSPEGMAILASFASSQSQKPATPTPEEVQITMQEPAKQDELMQASAKVEPKQPPKGALKSLFSSDSLDDDDDDFLSTTKAVATPTQTTTPLPSVEISPAPASATAPLETPVLMPLPAASPEPAIASPAIPAPPPTPASVTAAEIPAVFTAVPVVATPITQALTNPAPSAPAPSPSPTSALIDIPVPSLPPITAPIAALSPLTASLEAPPAAPAPDFFDISNLISKTAQEGAQEALAPFKIADAEIIPAVEEAKPEIKFTAEDIIASYGTTHDEEEATDVVAISQPSLPTITEPETTIISSFELKKATAEMDLSQFAQTARQLVQQANQIESATRIEASTATENSAPVQKISDLIKDLEFATKNEAAVALEVSAIEEQLDEANLEPDFSDFSLPEINIQAQETLPVVESNAVAEKTPTAASILEELVAASEIQLSDDSKENEAPSAPHISITPEIEESSPALFSENFDETQTQESIPILNVAQEIISINHQAEILGLPADSISSVESIPVINSVPSLEAPVLESANSAQELPTLESQYQSLESSPAPVAEVPLTSNIEVIDTAHQSKELIKKMEELTNTKADWCQEFSFSFIDNLKLEHSQMSEQIRQLQSRLASVAGRIAKIDLLKEQLLVGETDTLLTGTQEVLTRLGFQVQISRNTPNELWLSNGEQIEAIARVVRSNGTTNRTEIAQLAESVIAFWDEYEVEPKGILIAQTFVDLAPSARTEPDFTQALQEFANKKHLCIMSSTQLLAMYKEAELKALPITEMCHGMLETSGKLIGFSLEGSLQTAATV
jgi:hypothetical protein